MCSIHKYDKRNIIIEESWKELLSDQFDKEYFRELTNAVKNDISSGIRVFPKGSEIFNAFKLTPIDSVKVVILGQDPYHGEGQAHGLSFSVPPEVALPPSLRNIFKELKADTGIDHFDNGSLVGWAKQGVFLLNAVLTVRAGLPASHAKIGWTQFTDAVIKKISDNKSGVIFLLWGNFAKSKRSLIETPKHIILEASHPSPLARTGFAGCRHFSKTNEILEKKSARPIDWSR